MKKWDNPEIVELAINETYKDQASENYADEWDTASGAYVQGFSESGPVIEISQFTH